MAEAIKYRLTFERPADFVYMPLAQHARPTVFRELLIHDGNTRRIRGIGRQEAPATQNRHPHRREVPFIDGVHCRR